MMADLFLGLQRVFSSLFSVRVLFFQVLLFSSTNDPSMSDIKCHTCIRFSPSAVSIPFDLRHPQEAWADLPQRNLVLSTALVLQDGG